MSSGNLRVTAIFGTRPQFVKLSALDRAVRAHNERIAEPKIDLRIVDTGQHYDYDMSQGFIDELRVTKPHVCLGIGSGPHGAQTGAMLVAVEEELVAHPPNWVLVFGDTNSTVAGALAASKLIIPVAHVEAGLRSFNRKMPEEINRVITDHLASLLLCPSDVAIENLKAEGIVEGVHKSGDVMLDCLHFSAERTAAHESTVLSTFGLTAGTYMLTTLHRAENTNDRSRLSEVLAGLGAVAAEMEVILPLHPRTRNALAEHGLAMPAGITVTEPAPYLTMLALMRNARIVATDSGGVQKEAHFFHVPCVTLREQSEWPETIASGWNRLAMGSASEIAAVIRRALADESPTWSPLYGDGNSAYRIVELLVSACHLRWC